MGYSVALDKPHGSLPDWVSRFLFLTGVETHFRRLEILEVRISSFKVTAGVSGSMEAVFLSFVLDYRTVACWAQGL